MKSPEEIEVLFIAKVNETLARTGTIGEAEVRQILFDIWPETLLLPEPAMRKCIVDMYNAWVDQEGHDEEAKWTI